MKKTTKRLLNCSLKVDDPMALSCVLCILDLEILKNGEKDVYLLLNCEYRVIVTLYSPQITV